MNPFSNIRMLATGISFLFLFQNGFLAYAAEINQLDRAQMAGQLPGESNANSRPNELSRSTIPHQIHKQIIMKDLKNKGISNKRLFNGIASLPASLGRFQVESNPKLNRRSTKWVFYIQDIHLLPEAQSKIAKTVRTLIENESVDLMALEGAFGPSRLSDFRHLPRQNDLKKVADDLFAKQQVSGPAYAALTAKGPVPPTFGIDDLAAYNANLRALQNGLKGSPHLRKDLSKLNERLSQEKSNQFNSDLLAFDAEAQKYHTGKISLNEFLPVLAQHPDQLNVNTALMAHAIRLEESINIEKANEERNHLLGRILKNLPKSKRTEIWDAGLALQDGTIHPRDFNSIISQKAEHLKISLSDYPQFKRSVDTLSLVHKIEGPAAHTALGVTEKNIYEKLAKTADEKRLVRDDRNIRLVAKLIDFSLTENEWREFKNNKNQIIRTLATHKFNTSKKLEPFFQFYAAAEKRDALMAQNTLGAINREKAEISVLVTGGFHQNGILQKIRAAGINVISFTPNVTKAAEYDSNKTLKQIVTLTQNYENGSNWFLAPWPAPPAAQIFHQWQQTDPNSIHRTASINSWWSAQRNELKNFFNYLRNLWDQWPPAPGFQLALPGATLPTVTDNDEANSITQMNAPEGNSANTFGDDFQKPSEIRATRQKLGALLIKPQHTNWKNWEKEIHDLRGGPIGTTDRRGQITLHPIANYSYLWSVLGLKVEDWKGRIVDTEVFQDHAILVVQLKKGRLSIRRTFRLDDRVVTYKSAHKTPQFESFHRLTRTSGIFKWPRAHFKSIALFIGIGTLAGSLYVLFQGLPFPTRSGFAHWMLLSPIMVGAVVTLSNLQTAMGTIRKTREDLEPWIRPLQKSLKENAQTLIGWMEEASIAREDQFDSEAMDFIAAQLGANKINSKVRERIINLVLYFHDKFGIYPPGIEKPKKEKIYSPKEMPKDPKKRKKVFNIETSLEKKLVEAEFFKVYPHLKRSFQKLERLTGLPFIEIAADINLFHRTSPFPSTVAAANALSETKPQWKTFVKEQFRHFINQRTIKRKKVDTSNLAAENFIRNHDLIGKPIEAILTLISASPTFSNNLLKYQAIRETYEAKANEDLIPPLHLPFTTDVENPQNDSRPYILFGEKAYGIFHLPAIRDAGRHFSIIEPETHWNAFLERAIQIYNLDDSVDLINQDLNSFLENQAPDSIGLLRIRGQGLKRGEITPEFFETLESKMAPGGRLILSIYTGDKKNTISPEAALNKVVEPQMRETTRQFFDHFSSRPESWDFKFGHLSPEKTFIEGETGYKKDLFETPTLFIFTKKPKPSRAMNLPLVFLAVLLTPLIVWTGATLTTATFDPAFWTQIYPQIKTMMTITVVGAALSLPAIKDAIEKHKRTSSLSKEQQKKLNRQLRNSPNEIEVWVAEIIEDNEENFEPDAIEFIAELVTAEKTKSADRGNILALLSFLSDTFKISKTKSESQSRPDNALSPHSEGQQKPTKTNELLKYINEELIQSQENFEGKFFEAHPETQILIPLLNKNPKTRTSELAVSLLNIPNELRLDSGDLLNKHLNSLNSDWANLSKRQRVSKAQKKAAFLFLEFLKRMVDADNDYLCGLFLRYFRLRNTIPKVAAHSFRPNWPFPFHIDSENTLNNDRQYVLAGQKESGLSFVPAIEKIARTLVLIEPDPKPNQIIKKAIEIFGVSKQIHTFQQNTNQWLESQPDNSIGILHITGNGLDRDDMDSNFFSTLNSKVGIGGRVIISVENGLFNKSGPLSKILNRQVPSNLKLNIRYFHENLVEGLEGWTFAYGFFNEEDQFVGGTTGPVINQKQFPTHFVFTKIDKPSDFTEPELSKNTPADLTLNPVSLDTKLEYVDHLIKAGQNEKATKELREIAAQISRKDGPNAGTITDALMPLLISRLLSLGESELANKLARDIKLESLKSDQLQFIDAFFVETMPLPPFVSPRQPSLPPQNTLRIIQQGA